MSNLGLTMKMLTFVSLHVIGVALGAATLWWFVFPHSQGEAVADAVTARTVTSYVKIAAMRLGW